MTADRYVTSSGLVAPAVSTEQMRKVDQVAIDDVGLHLEQMMENAGRNLAELCMVSLGDGWHQQLIVVAAGTGGNGGGGICAARHLVNHGGTVAVVVSEPSRIRGVPANQLALYRAAGGHLVDAAQVSSLKPALVADAVVGYSLAGAPRGVAAALIEWINGCSAPVISLDVPSGIDATTGTAPGVCVSASTTMTLALPKQGLDGPDVGDLFLADIGIPREVYQRVGIDIPDRLFTGEYRVALSPWADNLS